MRLEGKTAIVTGAGSGIGRAVARAFAREGARVCVADINLKGARETINLISEAGGEAQALEVDVTQEDQVEAMVSRTVEWFGGVDILVNNAGIDNPGTLTSASLEQWEQIINVNLKAVLLGIQKAVPAMKKAKKGKIINTASMAAFVSLPFLGLYSVTKAGVVALTRSAALELAAKNITVNCVCPGWVDTPLTHDFLEFPAMRKMTLERTPLKTLARPEQIAPAYVFLASDESDFMTGQALILDGGYTIL